VNPPRNGEELCPLLTVHRVGNRVEIAAVSPEAGALGLHRGMALSQARAMIPGLDVRDSDPEADAALLARLALFAVRRWTPRAAIAGTDGLILDLDGVTHRYDGEERMVRHILAVCARAGFAARLAVAGTAGAAHALARYGREPSILCPPGGEARALASLPLAALRVEEEAIAAARRLGVETVGELGGLPRGPLVRRFGKALLLRLDQALGRAGEALDPVVPEAVPSAAQHFAEPIATAEAIGRALDGLLARLADTLTERSLGVRRLVLLCARLDGEVQRLALGTARATRDLPHLRRLIWAKIEKIEPGFGLEAMRLVAARVEPLAPQPVDGGLAGEAPAPDLAPLVDRLAGRLGARRLYRWSAVESDVPERSVRRVDPLAAAVPWPDWPRPVRLLSPPERIDKVMYELPDQAPIRFAWRGRTHRVGRADGPERIHGEWWRRPGEAAAVRDYFQVEDEEGARFWLYRRGDGVDPDTADLGWYLHGVFG
jgi:protein ImuB